MPGRLRNSFRSGNIAEHLGLLLLKEVTAVAEVTRPEDIGIDAIATLLRRDEDGNSYGEETFFVQLKSASASKIEYEDHELEWLVNQELPMFIGLVSLEKSQISLYSTIFVNQAYLAMEPKEITLRFGQSNLEWLPWISDSGEATVWLGEPLLRWSINDVKNKDWNENTYKMLKNFIKVTQREIELLSFGQQTVIDWETNKPNSITSAPGFMKGNPDDLESIVKRIAPYLKSLVPHAFSKNDDSAIKLAISLLTLADALREMGIEIDSENIFGKFFSALNAQKEDDGS